MALEVQRPKGGALQGDKIPPGGGWLATRPRWRWNLQHRVWGGGQAAGPAPSVSVSTSWRTDLSPRPQRELGGWRWGQGRGGRPAECWQNCPWRRSRSPLPAASHCPPQAGRLHSGSPPAAHWPDCWHWWSPPARGPGPVPTGGPHSGTQCHDIML